MKRGVGVMCERHVGMCVHEYRCMCMCCSPHLIWFAGVSMHHHARMT